jgi:16S rRNA (uracil1498-N3)-methyltransferase
VRLQGQRLSALEPPESLVVGPEGGFTTDEVAAAERAGVTLAGLGPRILRSESVAVAAAAVILSRTGDFA